MTVHSLRDDERGQGPFVVVASIAVFVLVSVGLAFGLIASLQVSAAVNGLSQAEQSATAVVRDIARQGYDAAAALPAQATITLMAGSHTADGFRSIEVNPASRTARITVYTPPFTGAGFGDPARCLDDPSGCTVVTELVSGAGFEDPS